MNELGGIVLVIQLSDHEAAMKRARLWIDAKFKSKKNITI